MNHYDIIIIGAGAAGLMAARIAGGRGRSVLVLDHAKTPGEKIRISGGGRCNFTNRYSGPENFLSQNPHFCKSALAGYSPQDFIDLVERHGIAYHEKENPGAGADIQLGQLFCDGKSQQIIDMLLSECKASGVKIWLETEVEIPQKTDNKFTVKTSRGDVKSESVIVACGGPSIPKMGASGFGYKIAKSFDLRLIESRPALVPLTLAGGDAEAITALAGTAAAAQVSCGKASFKEALLLTHRGLSGPAILQISSYWREGEDIAIDLAPSVDITKTLSEARQAKGKSTVKAFLSEFMAARLAEFIAAKIGDMKLGDLSAAQMEALITHVKAWTLRPAGSEGYRKAEVTLGGVDTQALSSKTMEARAVPGLYFIGEVVDVTGHLGGHNFQWAWASGYAAGNAA